MSSRRKSRRKPRQHDSGYTAQQSDASSRTQSGNVESVGFVVNKQANSAESSIPLLPQTGELDESSAQTSVGPSNPWGSERATSSLDGPLAQSAGQPEVEPNRAPNSAVGLDDELYDSGRVGAKRNPEPAQSPPKKRWWANLFQWSIEKSLELMNPRLATSRDVVYGDTQDGKNDLRSLIHFFRMVYDEEAGRRRFDTVMSALLAALSIGAVVIAIWLVCQGTHGFRTLILRKEAVGDLWVLAISNGGAAIVILGAAAALFQSSKNYGDRAVRHGDLMARYRTIEIMIRLLFIQDRRITPDEIETIVQAIHSNPAPGPNPARPNSASEYSNQTVDALTKISASIRSLIKPQDS
jgi:hypothetical protein